MLDRIYSIILGIIYVIILSITYVIILGVIYIIILGVAYITILIVYKVSKYYNVPHGRAGHPGEPVTFAKTTLNLTHLVMSQRKRAKKPVNEGGIQLAVQAIKRDATLSQRRAAKIYRVPQSTISDRLARASLRRDCAPNLIKLTSTEELIIV